MPSWWKSLFGGRIEAPVAAPSVRSPRATDTLRRLLTVPPTAEAWKEATRWVLDANSREHDSLIETGLALVEAWPDGLRSFMFHYTELLEPDALRRRGRLSRYSTSIWTATSSRTPGLSRWLARPHWRRCAT